MLVCTRRNEESEERNIVRWMFEGKKEEREKRVARPGHDQRSTTAI